MHLQYVASSLVNGQQENCHLQIGVPSLESVSTSSKPWMGTLNGSVSDVIVCALFKDPRKHRNEEDGEQIRWQHTSLIYNVSYGKAIWCFACFLDLSHHTRVNFSAHSYLFEVMRLPWSSGLSLASQVEGLKFWVAATLPNLKLVAVFPRYDPNPNRVIQFREVVINRSYSVLLGHSHSEVYLRFWRWWQ